MSQHTSRPRPSDAWSDASGDALSHAGGDAPVVDDEPPVDSSNWLHHILVGLHALTRLPAWVLALLVLALVACAGALGYVATRSAWAWLMAGLYLLFSLADWAWLALLPRWRISFGPIAPPLLGLLAPRLALGSCVAAGFGVMARVGLAPEAGVLIGLLLQVVLSAAVVYATYVEPFRLGVTHLELTTCKLPAGQRVRLVQLSDLHVERITRREQELVERVNALEADYVLLTGDYLNFSYVGEPRAIADARQVLGSLKARQGVYAVRGTHQVDPNAVMSALFDGLSIRWLRNEFQIVRQDGYQIAFAGASCTRRRDIDLPALDQALAGVPEDSYAVLLYHSPELVPDALARGVDLYLAGHTHGGQVRLPLYGALFTATDVGKRYEMGCYPVQGLTLYVSRGLGMEGMAAPRARFLCPPEIVCIDLVGLPAVGGTAAHGTASDLGGQGVADAGCM